MPRISRLALAGAVFALSSSARAEPAPRFEKLREAYFNGGWAKAGAEAAPIKALEAVPHPCATGTGRPDTIPRLRDAPAPEDDGPFHVEHAQIAHMYITRNAYEMYMAQFPGSELSGYIGDYADGRPLARDDGNVVAGSYDEDEAHYTPFDDQLPMNRHFWDYRGGPYAGLAGFDSSVNRAQKYMSGGYGLGGKYDEAWSASGKRKGTQGHGAVYLYGHGEKAKAYWYLGHAAHLLEDLTVPAHAHLWAHVTAWMDAYETYMEKAHTHWPALTSEPVESFDTLFAIFEATARVSDRYDAGNDGGFSGGVDGSSDRGRRRAGGFNKAELDEEASVLMPLAHKRVAALFRYFYKQVDAEGPKVALEAPVRSADGDLTLKASAADEVSGVDRSSFVFYSSDWNGSGWSDWTPVGALPSQGEARFKTEGGKTYRFKAKAKDGAGNVGESALKTYAD